MKTTKNKLKVKSVLQAMYLLFFCVLGFTASHAQVQTYGSLFIGSSGTIHLGSDISGSFETENTGSYGKLILATGSTTTGAANANFLNGYGSISTTTAFTIPVGQSGVYGPLQLTPTSVAAVDAAYLRADASTIGSSLDQAVLAVSKVEYWNIKGTNSTTVSLTWRASSNLSSMGVDALTTNLSIVAFEKATSKWVVVPSTIDSTSLLGGASNSISGSISSTAVIDLTAYEYFTLGAKNETALLSSVSGLSEAANGVVASIRNNVISFESSQPLSQYEVFDLTGRSIASSAIENKLNYTAPFLFPDAVYIVKAKQNNGVVTSFKLINQN